LAANPAESNRDIVRAMDITGRLLKLDAAVALVLSGELTAQLGRREKALELNPAAIGSAFNGRPQKCFQIG
jgi:hypothetical protein